MERIVVSVIAGIVSSIGHDTVTDGGRVTVNVDITRTGTYLDVIIGVPQGGVVGARARRSETALTVSKVTVIASHAIITHVVRAPITVGKQVAELTVFLRSGLVGGRQTRAVTF